MSIDSRISLSDIKDVLLKYSFEDNNKYYYYSRKNNIGNLMYDHFFKRLYHILDDDTLADSDEGVKNLIQAIEYCNTDYIYDILDIKPNFNFTDRKFRITNFYNVLLYEVYLTKIFKEIILLINENNLNDFLVNKEYFGYFSNINYKYKNKEVVNLRYKHYDKNWLKFEKTKKDLCNEFNYYIETDIKSFYDEIDHELLIEKLKYFLHKYGNKNSDEFLYAFSNILYKVNGYNKVGIPQGPMGSDIISGIFLWLLKFIDKDINGFSSKNGINKLHGLDYISYNDDYIFFSNNDLKLENIFNSKIKPVFKNNLLKLNLPKTSEVLRTNTYPFYDKIDFDLIVDKNSKEITKLKNIFINELKKDLDQIDIQLLKRYFKWIHNLDKGKKMVKQSFIKHTFKILFEDITGKDRPNKIKKIFLLLVMSPSNFVYIISLLEKYFQETYSKSFEDIFLKFILISNYYYVSDAVLLKLYLDLNLKYFKLSYTKTSDFIFDLIKSNNNIAIKSFLIDSSKPLDLILKDNGLVGLYNLIYQHKNIHQFKENIIGIKLFSLFNIDIDYSSINNYLSKNKNEHISSLKMKLNNIMDDMLIIKNISPNFYLKNPSFLSDLYSILNILLTILFNISNKRIVDIKINGGKEEGYINIIRNSINNASKKESLRKNIPTFDLNNIHLLYYIAKQRAIYNHKESNIDDDIKSFIYQKNKDLITFNHGIYNLVIYILDLINKELLSKET